jgi:uncharacterized protein YeaO (DUF488 family)
VSIDPDNVRIKDVREPPSPSDGRRILVTRRWPMYVRREAADEWIKELGPSNALLDAILHKGIDWPTYKVRYLKEMESEEAKTQIRRLADIARSETITLMCVCKNELECHRSLLRDLVLEEGKA